MKYFLIVEIAFFCLVSMKCSTNEVSGSLLVNHVGYALNSPKKVIFQTQSNGSPEKFEVRNLNDEVVYIGRFEEGGPIDQWHTGNAFEGIFTELDTPGDYIISVNFSGKTLESGIFTLGERILSRKCLPLLVEGFRLVRCSGEYDEKDRKISFFGDRKDTVDVHGGWYDASGEKGKYLSHLCFTNYMVPQQTPMFVWNMMETLDRYQGQNKAFISDLKEEIAFGADFLVRMQDDERYFYLTIFANWSWDVNQREISAYVGQRGEKNDQYQAGFREGGGMAIATLARASKGVDLGEFSGEDYLEVAKRGFAHLLEYNTKYIDDGKENIIDDYCALMAATELFKATQDPQYLAHARKRMKNLIGKQTGDDQFNGWWGIDENGERPYFHGAEAGLPLVSLSRYLEVEEDEMLRNDAAACIQTSVDFELGVTGQVFNPFGYARQYIKAIDEPDKRESFFFPHINESGYWWQGENARLGSLAAAMHLTLPYLREDQKDLAIAYATDQINWILGLNPFNTGMLEGIGHNNPVYHEGGDQLNVRGGVCNGITSGFDNEHDIAFMPLPQNDDMNHRWRWSEQWTLHGAWLMLALGTADWN